jgi:hypothetical protein
MTGNFSFYVDGGLTVPIIPDTTDYLFDRLMRNVINISKNEYGQDFNVTVVKKTKITDITAGKLHVRIYPNPTSTKLHVKFSSQETADYVIYNIMGQVLQQGKLQETSVIDVESLASGMYYLKIVGKENTTVKFVKQ